MTRTTGTVSELLAHCISEFRRGDLTLWVGEDVSSNAVSTGFRLIRRIARATHHALLPLFRDVPGVTAIESALQAVGSELAVSLADRTIGRVFPMSLEDPFEERRARVPAWEALLSGSLKGSPTYIHRAIIALLHAGKIGRLVTANQDDLLEQAAAALGVDLPTVHALSGEVPAPGSPPFLFRFHGSGSPSRTWPLDIQRLHHARYSPAMRLFREMVEHHPLMVMGYLGPNPLDLDRVLCRTRPFSLVWCDDRPVTLEARQCEPDPAHALDGDFPDRLLQFSGGWRIKGRLTLLLETFCHQLGIDVPGPCPDDEITAVRHMDDLGWPVGEVNSLPGILQPLGKHLRERWIGAFALLNHLDLWSDQALEGIFSRRQELERTLPDPAHRSWLRYYLAQTGRIQVEAAFVRHFKGLSVPPVNQGALRRLERAVAAMDLVEVDDREAPVTAEELQVERSELTFARTGNSAFLPSASQAIAEVPSATHADRWLRLKAAGASSRRQWSVAIQELSRALPEGGEPGAPLIKLRARVGMAAVITRLLGTQDRVPLVGCLKALKRRDPGLSEQDIDYDSCEPIALALCLRMIDEALESYAPILPTLQPPMGTVTEDFVRLSLRAFGDGAGTYLFDRHPSLGRTYRFIPHVEMALLARMVEAQRQRPSVSVRASADPT